MRIASIDTVSFLGYFPHSPQKNGVVWTPDKKQAAGLQQNFGNNVDVISTTLQVLEKQAIDDQPAMIIIRPLSSVDSEKLLKELPAGLNASTSGRLVGVNHQNVNKGTGVV